GTVADLVALVTGSRGGVVGVWSLDPPERVATVTLDDPITDLRLVDGTISVRTGGGRDRVLELTSR
ncbi:MAG: hypothetical protein R3246_14030, partial [Acidimicrobiia bacterium]|nr:hypothetical protein [Acidimicrobiia bacterium]